MKTNKIMALLAICGLFAGSTSLVVAHNHNGGSCRTCNDKCATCPQTHEKTCEAKPTCVKYVEAYHAPCKQCTTNCSYTCPVGYEQRAGDGSVISTTDRAAQDSDWENQRSSGKSYSEENGSKTYKKGKKMKTSTEVVE